MLTKNFQNFIFQNLSENTQKVLENFFSKIFVLVEKSAWLFISIDNFYFKKNLQNITNQFSCNGLSEEIKNLQGISAEM